MMLVHHWLLSLLVVVAATCKTGTTTAWMMSMSTSASSFAPAAPSNLKVTVVGGTGFVGSRVCKLLVEKGASVTSVSKSGIVPKWCYDSSRSSSTSTSTSNSTNDGGDVDGDGWVKKVNWVAADLLLDDESKLVEAMGSPDAVVSCVGVVGTDSDELLKGNGVANVNAFQSATMAAAAAGSSFLKKTALVSVSSEVVACEGKWPLPDFFSGYFQGKQMAEKAAMEAAAAAAAAEGSDNNYCTIVRPSFIYGGDSFGLFPPRVNYEYGSAVEELLSLGIVQALADITPPGLIKVALRPPSSVDAVAAACVAGVLDEIEIASIPPPSAGAGAGAGAGAAGGGRIILDGTAAINAATNQPAATGLTEALEWAKEKSIMAYDWAKVEVPKAIDWTKNKIEEIQKK